MLLPLRVYKNDLLYSFCLIYSTDGVFPNGLKDCNEDMDISQLAGMLSDGYSQSKWVAEQLVKRAMDRGLPAAIYRPGRQ